jgi:hypothetical protein
MLSSGQCDQLADDIVLLDVETLGIAMRRREPFDASREPMQTDGERLIAFAG